MEKLLIIATCTTEKGKVDANAQRPTQGLGDFFLQEGAYIKDLFNFMKKMTFDYTYLIFWPNHLSNPDA